MLVFLSAPHFNRLSRHWLTAATLALGSTATYAQTSFYAQVNLQGVAANPDYYETNSTDSLPLSWSDVSDGYSRNESFHVHSWGGTASGTFTGRGFDGQLTSESSLTVNDNDSGATNTTQAALNTDRIDFNYNGLSSATIVFDGVFTESFSHTGTPTTYNNFASARLDVTRWVQVSGGYSSVETQTILFSEQVTQDGAVVALQMLDPISFTLGSGDILTLNTSFNLTTGSGIAYQTPGSTHVETGLVADFFIDSMTAGLEITSVRSGIDWQAASAVPEPSTYAALCGVGALGLACWRRRRTAASAGNASA